MSLPTPSREPIVYRKQQQVVDLCSCERPLPRERAETKWAAATYCERCGLQMQLRFR